MGFMILRTKAIVKAGVFGIIIELETVVARMGLIEE